jgi:glycerol uptake facilitator-like aquaporin
MAISLALGTKKAAFFAEFIGTFLYSLTLVMARINSPEMAPIANGFMVSALTFAFGYLSGAHFNPAITTAVYMIGQVDKPTVILYFIAQCGGAFAAAMYVVMINGPKFPVPDVPNEIHFLFRCFTGEFIYAFLLCSVILHICWSKQRGNIFYGFAIGATVVSATFCIRDVSGGVFNPAIATGLQVARCLTTYCDAVVHLPLYWAAPMCAAVAASALFNALTASMASDEDQGPREME